MATKRHISRSPVGSRKRRRRTKIRAITTSSKRRSKVTKRIDTAAETKLQNAHQEAIEEQPAKNIERVNFDELMVDMTYQRPIKDSHVRSLIMYFDWDNFSVPTVGRRKNGALYVVDGQQRITAASSLGATSCYAEVKESTGPKYEANLFHQINAVSRKPSKLEIFRSALRAGQETAVAINKAVEAAGFKIALEESVGATAWPYIKALTQLERLYRFGGSEFLTDVLSLINEMWEGEDDAVRENIIGGMHRFIRFNRLDGPRNKSWLHEVMATRGITRRERIVEQIAAKNMSAAGVHNLAANSKLANSGYTRAEAVQQILEDTCKFRGPRRRRGNLDDV